MRNTRRTRMKNLPRKNAGNAEAEGRKKAQKAQKGFVLVERAAQGLDASGEWVDLGPYFGHTISNRFYALRRELIEPQTGVPPLGWKDVRLIERTVIEVVLKQSELPEAGKP